MVQGMLCLISVQLSPSACLMFCSNSLSPPRSGDSLSTITMDQTHFQQAQEERDIIQKPPPGYQESFQEESHHPCVGVGYYGCIEGVDNPMWWHDTMIEIWNIVFSTDYLLMRVTMSATTLLLQRLLCLWVLSPFYSHGYPGLTLNPWSILLVLHCPWWTRDLVLLFAHV